MVQSPTVFEDVVKTICTTNCTWSATMRMVHAIVEHLGERAPAPSRTARGAEPSRRRRRWPRPASPSTRTSRAPGTAARTCCSSRVRSPTGELDLEAFGDRDAREELSDEELEERLLALPGVGPYAAAHIMMTLGRYHRLILDSWTRPTYAKKVGRAKVSDAAIERRFRRYGPYAGLAFWLYLTRDWVD